MIRTAVLLCLLLAATAPQGLAAMKAQDFVDKAAVAGLFEIRTSEVALERSRNAGVQSFAREMIADHRAANAELRRLADQERLQVPRALDGAHERKLGKLIHAADVDPTYLSMQRLGHERAIDMFRRYAEQGDNEALKGFAASSLGMLREHREDVEALAAGAERAE